MFNDRSLLGLTLETARDKISQLGLTISEFAGSEHTIIFPVNYQPNRINVRLAHGIIVSIVGRG